MKKNILAVFAIFLASSAAAQFQQQLTEEALMELDVVRQACGQDKVPTTVRYVYEFENRVIVTCEDAEGFLPLAAAGLGLGGVGAAAAVVGIAAAAAAAGGLGGSTPDTQ